MFDVERHGRVWDLCYPAGLPALVYCRGNEYTREGICTKYDLGSIMQWVEEGVGVEVESRVGEM